MTICRYDILKYKNTHTHNKKKLKLELNESPCRFSRTHIYTWLMKHVLCFINTPRQNEIGYSALVKNKKQAQQRIKSAKKSYY
jgi:hypothetical protein